ncbi:unnamed protein product [Caenorhabditis nigoni]
MESQGKEKLMRLKPPQVRDSRHVFFDPSSSSEREYPFLVACVIAIMSRVLFVFIEICLGVLQDPAVMIQSMGDQKFGTDRIVCFTERESNESRKKVGETASREQETSGADGSHLLVHPQVLIMLIGEKTKMTI